MSGFFTTIRNRKKPVYILIEMVNVWKICLINNPPFQVFSTLLWGVKNLRASPSGFLLPRAKCKKPEMGGYS